MRKTVSFDRIARLYRFGEYLSFGRLLERVRTHFLAELGSRRKALVLGDGDGRFTAQLLHEQPHLQVLAVDTSAAMLMLLRRHCERLGPGGTARLQTWNVSALRVVSAPEVDLGETDLVATHFFLDCLQETELQALARTLAAGLPEGALWLVSDFDLPRQRLFRPFAALYIRLLYLAFRVLTGLQVTRLPRIDNALREAGFLRLQRREFAAGLLYTELWQRHRPQTPEPTAQPEPPRPHPPERMPIDYELPDSETLREPFQQRLRDTDAQSDPEPTVPSLPAPDRGVFQHETVPAPAPFNTPPRKQEQTGAPYA